jgi:hypothetical protein
MPPRPSSFEGYQCHGATAHALDERNVAPAFIVATAEPENR